MCVLIWCYIYFEHMKFKEESENKVMCDDDDDIRGVCLNLGNLD